MAPSTYLNVFINPFSKGFFISFVVHCCLVLCYSFHFGDPEEMAQHLISLAETQIQCPVPT